MVTSESRKGGCNVERRKVSDLSELTSSYDVVVRKGPSEAGGMSNTLWEHDHSLLWSWRERCYPELGVCG